VSYANSKRIAQRSEVAPSAYPARCRTKRTQPPVCGSFGPFFPDRGQKQASDNSFVVEASVV
jgi:hypothetical protein